MNTKPLLLEIGTEEIPAGFLPRAIEAIETLARAAFSSNHLAFSDCGSLGSPRRITLWVRNLAVRQPDREERFTGPPARVAFGPDGGPTKAAEGFARNHGIGLGDIVVEETEKGPYIVARKRIGGQAAIEILPSIIKDLILSLPFAKTMRWGDQEVRFVRPIRWIAALLGEEIIPVEIAGVRSGDRTWGHRFASPAPFQVRADIEDYVRILAEHGVIVRPEERRERLLAAARQAAREHGGEILPDEGLVEMNTNLTEFPSAVCGSFDRRFLALPRAVLITSMREHQKYFAVSDRNGALLPHFVAINNTLSPRPEIVRKGHERVLAARLSDAAFFFSEDKKRPLSDLVPRLSGVTFHKGLGSMLDKTHRVMAMATLLARDASPELLAVVERAAYLAKADLLTGMVGEFPTLQGIMGREYALVSGEDRRVAEAIAEHYLPVRAGGDIPASEAGALLAIADKADTICGTFALGLQPTGAADPYGLRRLALGILHILGTRGISFSLTSLIGEALLQLEPFLTPKPGLAGEILQFFLRRFHHDLVSKGMEGDVVEAATRAGFGDVPDCLARIRAISEVRARPEFDSLSIAFKRVMNILKGFPGGPVSPELLREDPERDLYGSYLETGAAISSHLDARRYGEAMEGLLGLKGPIDRFFEGVMVMTDDEAVRQNRLALLFLVSRLYLKVGDLSAIQTRQ